ncbi:MAG: aspartate aminotransferase family protein [Spirochaetes bacterium]|nr:aspartate aminotransferase family protein [Spirochaetota bacterium]
MSQFSELIKKEKQFVIQTYSRYPVALKKGDGVYVWDLNNKKYLDFLSGITVNNLGYNHKQIGKVIKESVGDLIHTSNLFYLKPQLRLAEKLSKCTNKGKVFFANSGAEANEAAIKFARAYGNQFKKARKKIITLKNSFHGRTLATIFATGQKKYQKGFQPKVGNYIYADANNITKIKKFLKDDVAAVLIELIQGEGGVNKLDPDFVRFLYSECKKKKILFMVDEIQTGYGRTGKLFAFQHYNIVPDVITMAKAMANGFPMGAMVVKKEVAGLFKPGMHASTFGGGYLISAVAEKVLDIINNKKFLKDVRVISEYFHKKLLAIEKKYDFVLQCKGMGLMYGLKMKCNCSKVVQDLLKQGLITNCVQNNVLRFLPPLIIQKKHVDEAVEKIDSVFFSL